MSQTISQSTGKKYGLKRVCSVWGVCRSTIYAAEKRKGKEKNPRGRKPTVKEEELLNLIREDIEASPFKGEGHRKVHARLKRKKIKVGRNRILKVMKKNQLLSPNRRPYRAPNPHEGKIITDQPNIMWGSDGTKIKTVKDGWVWVFSAAEHWNTECLGWHVCKKGDRFAALEPILQGVKRVYGGINKGIAKGLKLRIDNGSQYTSDYGCVVNQLEGRTEGKSRKKNTPVSTILEKITTTKNQPLEYLWNKL